MDVEQTSPELVHSPDLWFTDANLVLQVGSCLFRIHQMPLKSASPVFSDMLSFPQPHPPEIIYTDGAVYTLIRLPDSAQDVECFFKALKEARFSMRLVS
jgi:hypothetical protein